MEPVGRRSSRRIRFGLAALALLAVVTVGALYLPTLLKPEHVVPTLKSMSLREARGLTGPLHFKLVSTEAYNDKVRPGTIISQSVDPRSKLREDSTIRVTVSKGPEPVRVPDVRNKPLAEAKQILIDAKFTIDDDVRREPNEEIAKDIVLKVTPEDAELPKFSVITLTVSDGPAPRTISNWTNKTFEEARDGIQAAGLQVKRVDGYSDTVQVGRVISTTPGPGGKVAKGATVTVTVAVGTLTVRVPNVGGKTIAQATTELQAAGLRVGGVVGPGNGNNRTVVLTDPGAGETAKRGDAVTLYVKKN